jgi:hypothetical protein
MIVGKFTATDSFRFHILATDTDGFQNPAARGVRSHRPPGPEPHGPDRDSAPQRGAARRSPSSRSRLQDEITASARSKLMVDRLGDKKHWEVPLLNNAKPLEGVTWNRVESSAIGCASAAITADLAKLDPPEGNPVTCSNTPCRSPTTTA